MRQSLGNPGWGNPCEPGWWNFRYCVAALWLCVSEGSVKRQWALSGLWSFFWEEYIPQHSPWCQTLQFLPICHCHPSNCCPSAAAQRKWVCDSSKPIVDLLKGVSWESHSFFCHPNPHLFYSQSYGDLPCVTGTLNWVVWCGTGTLSWVVWYGTGIPHSWGIPTNFYPPHVGVGRFILHFHVSDPPSLLPVWRNVISLIPWLLDFHAAWLSDDFFSRL